MLLDIFYALFWYLLGVGASLIYIAILNRTQAFYKVDGIIEIQCALEMSALSWICVLALIFATIATILAIAICKICKWLSRFKNMALLKQKFINFIENNKD